MEERTDNAKPRDTVLDIARGIAAILVVWGHCIQYFSVNGLDFWESKVFQAIYSFHMPLFMLISGYLFFWTCKRKLKTVIIGRFCSVGIPMVTWGTIISLVLYRNDFTLEKWVEQIIGIWFLWAVLVSSVVVGIVARIKSAGGGKYAGCYYILMLLFGVSVSILPNHTNVLYVYPYFVLGYALNECKLFAKLKDFAFVAGVLWVILIFFYNKEHFIYISGILPSSLRANDLSRMVVIDVYRWGIGLVGSAAVIGTIQLIPHSFWHKMKFLNSIKEVGKYSLEIYVMQRLVLEICLGRIFEKVVITQGTNYFTGSTGVFYITTFLFACVLVMILVKISEKVERSKMLKKLLFGK